MRDGTTLQEQDSCEAALTASSDRAADHRQKAAAVSGVIHTLIPGFLAIALVACGATATQDANPGSLPAAPAGSGGGDQVPPSVNITSPASGSSTGNNVITIAGTASDNVAVTQVTWRNATTGTSGTANGTTTWSASGISLQIGDNVIIATAHDAAGNKRDTQITVDYSPASQTSALLTWSANTEPDLAGYRVYYGTAPGVYQQPKGQGIVVTGTTYTVAGLNSGTRYYFAVTAYDGSGNESDYSQEVFKDIP